MMTLYLLLSGINLVLALISFGLLIDLVQRYTISALFATYYMVKLATIMIVAFNQITTFLTPQAGVGWPLKFASTLICISAMMFYRIIVTSFSVKRERKSKHQ